jgi:hypothetical protein
MRLNRNGGVPVNVDVMERLARANPVPEPPAVVAPEGLRHLIEDDPRSTGADGRPPRRAHVRRRALAGVASIACASVVAVALLAGSSGSGSNVLAAVYAATAPKPGIVEAVTLTRTFGGPGHDSVARLREWSEASSASRRGMTTFTGSRFRSGVAQIDVLYKPREWETWGNDRGFRLLPQSTDLKPNIVHRIRWSGAFQPNDQHLGFLGGGILVGAEWAQLFRTLYSKGQMQVVGRERHSGRLLWKLEASPAYAEARAREDHTQFVVLVDPHTFLPVYTRLTNLALPGHPPVSESELLGYRTLPSTAANEKLFDLAFQHPHAQVVTQAGVGPGSSLPRGR